MAVGKNQNESRINLLGNGVKNKSTKTPLVTKKPLCTIRNACIVSVGILIIVGIGYYSVIFFVILGNKSLTASNFSRTIQSVPSRRIQSSAGDFSKAIKLSPTNNVSTPLNDTLLRNNSEGSQDLDYSTAQPASQLQNAYTDTEIKLEKQSIIVGDPYYKGVNNQCKGLASKLYEANESLLISSYPNIKSSIKELIYSSTVEDSICGIIKDFKMSCESVVMKECSVIGAWKGGDLCEVGLKSECIDVLYYYIARKIWDEHRLEVAPLRYYRSIDQERGREEDIDNRQGRGL